MTIENVPIERVKPNPYQPASRTNPSDNDRAKLGKSILDFGLILTPVGRRIELFYEMGDGWLRCKAFEWLVNQGHTDYDTIPIDVRDLGDQQMADLVIEANNDETRRGLNDIELAEYFKRYMKDFNLSQQALAERFNRSQGEVANTLRLLELPGSVQESIISQEISGTHGRLLLRLNKHPELQTEFVEALKKNPVSVSKLDLEISRNLWQNSKPAEKTREYNSPIFDLAECEKCEFRAMLANPYGQEKKEPRCTNVPCWEKKQEAAVKVRDNAAKKRLVKKVGGQKILTGNDVSYNQYAELTDYQGSYRQTLDNPEECDKCPKRALYKYSRDSSGEPKPICLDPKCYRAKKSKRTRETNKKKKEQDRALTVRIGQIAEKVSKNRHGALVVCARYFIRYMSASARDDVAALFTDLPKYSNGRLFPEVLNAKVIKMSEPELIKLIAAILISTKRRADTYEQFSTVLKDDLLTEISILEGTYDLRVGELSEFQVANCTGCGHAITELIKSGEVCCKESSSYYREIKNGICKTSPNKEALQKAAKEKAGGNKITKGKKPAAATA